MYRRVILKISGEALQGKYGYGIDPDVIAYIAEEIQTVLAAGVQVGIVIGGGNFFRGSSLFDSGLERVTGDQIGILATIINALAIRDIFEKNKINTAVMSAVPAPGIVGIYDRRKAIKKLESGMVVIFAGGTGNPLVTTDSALSLRGVELKADLLLKATNVDGIYNTDPRKDPNAIKYKKLTYSDAIEKELAVMDLSSFLQCRDYKMLLRVFNLNKSGALKRIIIGEDEGTLVQ